MTAENSSELGVTIPEYGSWFDTCLSPERFATYVRVCHGDRLLAYKLYRFNAEAAAAMMRDLGYLEVLVRNSYHQVLTEHFGHSPAWVLQANTLFPANTTLTASKQKFNEKMWSELDRVASTYCSDGVHVVVGKVVADLSFSFWCGLSDSIYIKTIWSQFLYKTWPTGTNPRWVHATLNHLRGLRNRAAHYEPVFREDLVHLAACIQQVAGLLSPEMRKLLEATTRLPRLEQIKP